MKCIINILFVMVLLMLNQSWALEKDSWYLQKIEDTTLKEVVLTRAVLDGRSSSGNLWKLVIECNSVSDIKKESPMVVYLHSPFADLWGGTRETSGFMISLNGRIKTDQRPSTEKQFLAFSNYDSLENGSLLWDIEGPLNQTKWEEFKSQLRGEELKLWPSFTSAKLLGTRLTSEGLQPESLDLNKYLDQKAEVTFNLGGVAGEAANKYRSDLVIEEIESFCNQAIYARRRYLDTVK